MHFIMIVPTIILFICAINISEETEIICNINVTAPGQYIRSNRVIKMLPNIGPKQCIRKCLQNGLCQSVNYRRHQFHCELIAAKHGEMGAFLELDSECDYIEMENQPQDLAGPCKSTSCKGQCTVLSSNKTHCTPEVIIGCEIGWVRFENKCYLFKHTSQTWFDAKSFCQILNSILAEPRTEAESQFLTNQAKSLGGSFWIGLSDLAFEGRWEYSSDQRVVTINDFGTNEPNGGDPADCLLMWQGIGGLWTDSPCTEGHKIICETNVTCIV